MGVGLGTDIGGVGTDAYGSAPVQANTDPVAPIVPTSAPAPAPQAAPAPAPQAMPQAYSPPPGGYMAADSQGNPVPVDANGNAVNPGTNTPTSPVPLRPGDQGVGAPMQLGSAYNPNAPASSPSAALPFMGANGLDAKKILVGLGKIGKDAGGGSTSGGAGSGARSFAQSGAAQAIKSPEITQSAPSAPIGGTQAAPWSAMVARAIYGANAPIFTPSVGQKPPGT